MIRLELSLIMMLLYIVSRKDIGDGDTDCLLLLSLNPIGMSAKKRDYFHKTIR